MRNALNLKVLSAVALLSAGIVLAGCKSVPDLPVANAQALIQAKYDQTPAVGANITVSDEGMQQGATAGYWTRTKVYPNKYWGDFTLTPAGKKVLKLTGGGDVIQWRPESPTDKKFVVVVVTVAANHLKAKDVKNVQTVGEGKSAEFTEAVNLDGVPDALQGIAHNPGNKLSTKRQADFVLDGGAWKLQSIE